MFGTIAKMKLKPGAYDKMADQMKGFEERQVKGFLFNVVYRSQSDPNEVWLVVGFEDEATYRANANDPQTDEMARSEEHTSELQSPDHLVCRLLLEKKKHIHMSLVGERSV